MLNSEKALFAMNDMDDGHLESARLRLGYHTGGSTKHVVKKRIITFALAAALILGLGAVAYAIDLFGIRALFMKNSTPVGNSNGGYVSFTQPQDVPEEMDESIRAKIDNSTKAWAEWDEWKDKNGLSFPEVYAPPEGVSFFNEEENPDGT